jgi:hypothetical protein
VAPGLVNASPEATTLGSSCSLVPFALGCPLRFRLTAKQRCGDHDVAAYLAQVNAMKRQFARMAASS